jgi:hypothetical protein
MTGAGIYEQAVLDTAWPHKPSIVSPSEGGIIASFFGVPGNIVSISALILATCAAWPVSGAQNATLALASAPVLLTRA